MTTSYIRGTATPDLGWWFVYQCPISGGQLFIDPDPSRGTKRPPAVSYMHPCHTCQTHHTFDASEIESINVED